MWKPSPKLTGQVTGLNLQLVWTLGKKKTSLASAGVEPRFLDHIVRSLALRRLSYARSVANIMHII
jgi:hypothetical protein